MTLIPKAALESHIGILGKTGSGKSNLAKVIAEQLMAANERVCAIDPTGTWWGLRLAADGKKPSPFKPVIFGGDHGDLALGEHHGAVLAEAIGTSAGSAIIDTQQMKVGERTRFVAAFAETILRANRGPLHLVLDEAHLFAPQGKVNDPQSGMMLHAVNNLVSLGRGRGLRIILISQRPAKLHKDSLSQIETLIAMRLVAPQDRAAVQDWVGEWADPAKGKEIIASLPSLPVGDGWVWSPQINHLERKHFPLAVTFDSGTAEANAKARELPPIDTAALGDKMDSIRQEAQANDPKRLKARIAELEREKAKPALAVDTALIEQMNYKKGYEDGARAGANHEAKRLGQKVLDFAADFALATGEPISIALPIVHTAAKAASFVAQPPSIAPITQERKRAVEALEGMSPSSIKLVDAIVAAYPTGMSLATAAKRAGLSRRSSAYGRYLREAASSPRIQDRGDGKFVAVAAEEGLRAPSGLDDFKKSLPPSYARMLEVLADSPNSEIVAEEIADRAGVSRTSSGLGAGLKELVALGLADECDGGYKLSGDFA